MKDSSEGSDGDVSFLEDVDPLVLSIIFVPLPSEKSSLPSDSLLWEISRGRDCREEDDMLL